jgi:CheY-like chemotaxis protein
VTEQDAIIADLQLSNMRLHEALATARAEVWTLRQIVATTAFLIETEQQPGGPSTETVVKLRKQLHDYFDSKSAWTGDMQ